MIVPDTIEPVVGWKGLGVSLDLELCSTFSHFVDMEWPAQKRFEAQCVLKHVQGVPNRDCACGIYVAERYRSATTYAAPAGALVEVYGWGKIVEHELGWRVQYAYPKQIILLNGVYFNDGEILRRAWSEAQVKVLSEKYGVPVMVADWDDYAPYKISPREPLLRAGKIFFGVNGFAQGLLAILAQQMYNVIISIVCLIVFAALMLVPRKKLPHERNKEV